ncbi:MAG: glycosyltransferase family 2 protein [Rikenellaceae bacterium]
MGKDKKDSIAAIILTFNESKHIERSIGSLWGVCDEVFVVDSFSSDDTVEKAEALGAKVYQNGWVNYAAQFNWALKNCDIKSGWIWRVDADEYLSGGLGQAVKKRLKSVDNDVNGVYVRKRIDFMGKPLLHGGWYPVNNLKIIRKGFGDCENRWMDEHLRIFEGSTIEVLQGDQVDYNLNDLTWWSEKHNGYATREMVDLLIMEYGLDLQGSKVSPKFWGSDEQRKRWLKLRYVKSPLFLRPFVNFFIRYVLKAGFLDGKEGFIWHFLQGFWYRFLVDAKIYELKSSYNFDNEKIKTYIKETYL